MQAVRTRIHKLSIWSSIDLVKQQEVERMDKRARTTYSYSNAPADAPLLYSIYTRSVDHSILFV